MNTYNVRWEIEVDAESHADAAKQAQEIQRDPDSIATVFHVSIPGERGARYVDLGPMEGEA